MVVIYGLDDKPELSKAVVLVTLVKAWYARCAKSEPSLKPQATPWYGRKARPSFADTLSALRCVLWRHRIFTKSESLQRVRKMIKAAAYGLFAAA